MDFLSKFEILPVKPRNGYFFDYSMLRYRKAIPEEYVRAGVVKSLQAVYGYLPIQISTEEPLWSKGRFSYKADVVLWEDGECKRPFALIEAKAFSAALTNSMIDKLHAYADCLEPRPKLIVLTNGNQALVVRTSDGRELSRFPTLRQSIRGLPGIAPLPPPVTYRRPAKTPFDVSGEKVSERLKTFPELAIRDSLVSLNAKRAYLGLYELLRDETVNLATRTPTWKGFRLIEDRLVRWSDFGNASGGRFPCKYRHLVLETPGGHKRDFCLSVSRYAKYPEAGLSSLAVIGGIDGKQALQLQSDVPSCAYSADGATLYHRGHISLGEGGRIAAMDVYAAIKKAAPEFLDGERILAAQVDADSLRGAAAQRVVLRLAVLSHILDQTRKRIRKQRASRVIS